MLLVLASIAAVVWGITLLMTVLYPKRDLADLPPDSPATGWPSLTIVFAALNEEESIEKAARSMLALDYPNLKVVAVNDRSTDRTGQILATLAATEPRLKVVTIERLPQGWLGKTNALEQARRSITTDMILITDADVVFSPDALRRAVAYSVNEQIDHLSLMPTMPLFSPGERMFVSLFALLMNMKFANWRIENPKDRMYIGVGAFSLVRRAALAAVGGFEPVKMSVDDDMRLGEAFKVNGYKLANLLAGGLVTVQWQPDFMGYIKGLEKNGFASSDFNPFIFAGNSLGLFIVGFAPHLALLIGPDVMTRTAGAVGVAALIALLYRARDNTHIGWWYALVMPLSTLAIQASLTLSVYKTYRQRGIVWRGHLYPIGALKAHCRERNAWADNAWRRHKPR